MLCSFLSFTHQLLVVITQVKTDASVVWLFGVKKQEKGQKNA